MEFNVYDQTVSFLVSAATGFILGVIYEFFRCFKINYISNRIIKDFWDILFVLVSVVFLFVSLFSLNGFSIRIYHILGLALGIIIYFNSVNRLFYIIFEKILLILQKILKILLYPVKFFSKIVLGIFRFLFFILKKPALFFKNVISNFIVRIKRLIKRRKKV